MWVGSDKTLFTEIGSWQKTAWKPSFSYGLSRFFLFLSAWQETTLPQQDIPRQYSSTLVEPSAIKLCPWTGPKRGDSFRPSKLPSMQHRLSHGALGREGWFCFFLLDKSQNRRASRHHSRTCFVGGKRVLDTVSLGDSILPLVASYVGMP